MELRRYIAKVGKIASVVVLVTIIIVLTSWFTGIPEQFVEACILGTMCVAAYLLGLLHASRVVDKSQSSKEVSNG